MKAEQIITSVYVLLGIVFAFLSNYLIKSFSNILLAISVPFVFYALSVGPLLKLGKFHKKNMLISNSLVTFFFVWIVAWIILFNF